MCRDQAVLHRIDETSHSFDGSRILAGKKERELTADQLTPPKTVPQDARRVYLRGERSQQDSVSAAAIGCLYLGLGASFDLRARLRR
jgi:hypothetical protein